MSLPTDGVMMQPSTTDPYGAKGEWMGCIQDADVMRPVSEIKAGMNPPGTIMAGVGELVTTDGVLLFFIGGEFNPSLGDGPLPSHLILSGAGWISAIIVLLTTRFHSSN